MKKILYSIRSGEKDNDYPTAYPILWCLIHDYLVSETQHVGRISCLCPFQVKDVGNGPFLFKGNMLLQQSL